MTDVASRHPTAEVRSQPQPVRPGVPARIRRLAGGTWWQASLAVALYLAFTCYLTWPVATDLGATVYGAPGDLTGSIADLRELVEDRRNPFVPGRVPDFGAPEGQPVPWTLNLATAPSTALLYVLALPFGPIASFTLFTILGYVASGAAMFLLLRKLGASFWVALLFGWAFAFYPFAVVNGAGHNHFVHGWPLVLLAWRMLVTWERPSLKTGVLAGLAAVLAFTWTPYFILLGGVTYAVLLAAVLISAWRRGTLGVQIRTQAGGAAIVIGFLGVMLALTAAAGGAGVREHTIEELNAYAARPLEYVVPPRNNPVVGESTGRFLATRQHGSNSTENTLYVGLTVLALAFLALLMAVRRRVPSVAWVAAALALVAAVWSAPPHATVAGVNLPFPSSLVMDITTTWRVYSRFVIVVMAAVTVLAALGVEAVLARRGTGVRLLALAVLTLLVPLDLWNLPKGIITTLKDPVIYEQVRRLPPGIVAEYPLQPSGFGSRGTRYSAEFQQRSHGKPILNGYLEGSTEEQRALGLASLEDPETPSRLALLGVKYVLLTKAPVEPGVTPPGTPGKGLQRLGGDAYADLYRVVAGPAAQLVSPGEGFQPPEGIGRRRFQWLSAATGEVELRAACAPCAGALTFEAMSFGRPRRLTVRSSSGMVLTRVDVPASRPVRVEVPLTLRGATAVELSASPPPQSVRDTTGAPDDRTLSVSVQHARFRPSS